METVLDQSQSELIAAERRLVLEVRDILGSADSPRADVDRMAALLLEMDELFLLVVVGEYNTGKSTFINALLGDEVFEMGDLPTTRAISILRHGTSGRPQAAAERVRVFRYPLGFLREAGIVDTPGTNAPDRI